MKKVVGVFLLSMVSVMALVGCASFGRSMKALVGGDPSPEPSATRASNVNDSGSAGTRYSEASNMPVAADRNYQRMSKDDFENEYLAKDKDGSLWVMEGQDSYLFSQNIVRLPGDIFNVVLDGQPQKQLSTKVSVIKDLSEAKRKPAAIAAAPAAPIPILGGIEAQKSAAVNVPSQPQTPELSEKTSKLDQFDVSQIPVRIVDRSIDGSYRVKGSQVFMIGKEEYKVIVSGLVRPNDVADGGVSASKIIDSKFDVVRSRKRGI